MYWILYHIASGHAFFTGLVLVMVSVFLSARPSRLRRRATGLSLLIGLILIVTSAAPLPWWPYLLFAGSILFWGLSYFRLTWRDHAPWSVIISCFILGGLEYPFHLTPALIPRLEPTTVTVIGDSVTAGLGGSDHCYKWPAMMGTSAV